VSGTPSGGSGARGAGSGDGPASPPATRRRRTGQGRPAAADPAELAETLAEGARRLGIDLGEEVLAGLLAHLDELGRWAPRLNLVSAQDLADPRALVERHVLDSLAAVPLVAPLGPEPAILDIGSGAGFPGIPVALAAGTSRALLVEPRLRRASFLRAVARRLPGCPLEVASRRFEDLDETDVGPGFDAILSRAALPLSDLLACARRWLRPRGRLVAFRGPGQTESSSVEGLRRLPDRPYQVAPGTPTMRLAAWEKVA